MTRTDPAVAAVCRIADRHPSLAPPTLQAVENWVAIHRHCTAVQRAVAELKHRSIPVIGVRIDPRKPRPFIEVENRGGYESLHWALYSWGHNEHGAFRRYAARLGDCMIHREEIGRAH